MPHSAEYWASFGVPLPGDLDSLDAGSQDGLLIGEEILLLQILEIRRLPRVQALGGVGLELDRIGASFGGDLDQSSCRRQVAIVVGTGFGDHVAGMPRSHRAVPDAELLDCRRRGRSFRHDCRPRIRHAPR